jgi:hypothetical protein
MGTKASFDSPLLETVVVVDSISRVTQDLLPKIRILNS